MLRVVPIVLCAALALLGESVPAQVEPAHGPPPWRDGASAYLMPEESHAAAGTSGRAVANTAQGRTSSPPALEVPGRSNALLFDPAVMPASAVAESPGVPAPADRYLAPPSEHGRFGQAVATPQDQKSVVQRTERRLAELRAPTRAIYTVASALAIVIGLLLVCVWLLRRGTRNMNAELPGDVVGVLGRVPLAARHFAQLLRVGNKLVLVSLTPSGATTLTEITDPAEVDRLAGLCQQSDPHSTTKAFEQVFRQLSREPAAPGFFGRESSPPLPDSSAASLFRSEREE